MSSKRSVRFDATTKGDDNKLSRAGADDDTPSFRKQKRRRPNEDELDDIDDFDADDGEGGDVPSERELLEAKRQRRQGQVKGVVGEGSTHIDETTSLATEGVEIEPFHMREEESDGTGYFDGDTYVFRKNPDGGDEEPDAWLDSLTDENGKQSADIAVQKESIENDEDVKFMDRWTKEKLFSKILPLLRDTETVAQAVRRYGQLVKRKGRRKNGAFPRKEESQDSENVAKSCLNDLTGVANALLLKGEVGIYDITRNTILTLLPKERHHSSGGNQPKLAPALWEYKGNQDDEVHGPYTTEQMIAWTGAGYFVGDQKVEIRTIREDPLPLSAKDDLLNDLLDDDEGGNDDVDQKFQKGPWQWSNEVNFSAYVD